jgi:hypothetical protein
VLSVTLRRPQRNAQGIADTRSSRAFRSFAIRSSSALSRACISLGARYPLPRCPANAHFQTTVRATNGACRLLDASTIQSTSSRPKLRAIDRRCTDNGRPHRRNWGNTAHRDPSSVVDVDGTAYRGRHQVRLRRTQRNIHGRNRWSCSLAATFRPCARSIVEGAYDLWPKTGAHS